MCVTRRVRVRWARAPRGAGLPIVPLQGGREAEPAIRCLQSSGKPGPYLWRQARHSQPQENLAEGGVAGV